MPQAEAIEHLRNVCVPNDPNDVPALVAAWTAAKATLGPSSPNAGRPDVQPLPAAGQPYINQLMGTPWAAAHLAPFLAQGATFNLVGVADLLALQHTVNTVRSATHCGHLNNPGLNDLLAVCLPTTEAPLDFIHSTVDPQSRSVLIMSRNTNLDMREWGVFPITLPTGINARLAGAQIVMRFPFVHVVRFNGRCYLCNGFHRVCGASAAGATHVPCLFRDVANAAEVGLSSHTFQLPLLESGNPPTVGHFTQGRALRVTLRTVNRVVHVSWAEYTMPVID
jgi:hypothetical protein